MAQILQNKVTSSRSFQKTLLLFACFSVVAVLIVASRQDFQGSGFPHQLIKANSGLRDGLRELQTPGRELQRSKHSIIWTPKLLSSQNGLDSDSSSLETPFDNSKLDAYGSIQFECKGSSPHEKGCRVGSLWFDTKKQVFIVEEGQVPPNDIYKHEEASETADESVLKSLNDLFSKPWAPKFQIGFNGVTANGNIPSRSNTCEIDLPVHLRASYKSHSFGHVLRDNYYGLTAVPRQFEESGADYAWVTWPRPDHQNAFKMSNIVYKYSSWIGNPQAWTWPQLMRTFCKSEDGSDKRFVHFGKALMSSGGNDWTSEERPNACGNADFGAMRDIAYRTAGIKHVPVKDQEQKRIVLIGKVISGERRGILNVDQAADALRKAFPGVKVDVQWMQRDHIKPDKQLKSMSKTTILIANIGSAGFRQMFLPDGAHAIIIGPPSDEFKGGDGKVYHVGNPFRELDRCFSHVKHWKVHPFQAGLNDVVLDPGRMSKVPEGGLDAMPEKQRSDFELKRMWDASVRLNIPVLTDVVGKVLNATS